TPPEPRAGPGSAVLPAILLLSWLHLPPELVFQTITECLVFYIRLISLGVLRIQVGTAGYGQFVVKPQCLHGNFYVRFITLADTVLRLQLVAINVPGTTEQHAVIFQVATGDIVLDRLVERPQLERTRLERGHRPDEITPGDTVHRATGCLIRLVGHRQIQ